MAYFAFLAFSHIWLKVMFLHGMGSGSCLSYTGLVLSEHTSPDSDLVFLSEPQVIFDFLNQSDMIFGTSYVRLMDLQANWFVSVSPLLSVGACERFGR